MTYLHSTTKKFLELRDSSKRLQRLVKNFDDRNAIIASMLLSETQIINVKETNALDT